MYRKTHDHPRSQCGKPLSEEFREFIARGDFPFLFGLIGLLGIS